MMLEPRLNMSIELEELMFISKVFQASGPATGKALSPNSVAVLGMIESSWIDKHS